MKKVKWLLLAALVALLAFCAIPQAARASSAEQDVYVLMNIPYDKFYDAEVDTDAPIDAVTSATKNKTRSTLAAGSYHVNTDGTDITGVVYPVKVTNPSVLANYKEITDADSVTITVTLRGKEVTTVYNGKDCLFEAPSYSFYRLSEAPSHYKVMSAQGDFGEIQGDATTIEGAHGDITYHSHHNNDVEIAMKDMVQTEDDVTVGINKGDPVSGVIATTTDGKSYALRHLVNIWRSTDIGWKDSTDPAAALQGKTIKNLRYITQDGIYDYPVDITTKPNSPTISASFTDAETIVLRGLPEDAENAVATVSHYEGQGNPPTILADNVPVGEGGTVDLTTPAVAGQSYDVNVVCDNYADMPADVAFGFVLMNIPYNQFYAAELAAGSPSVDAVSSATKTKPRSTLAAGSYHVNSDGTDITGVVYPVLVTDPEMLSGYKEVTDDATLTITLTMRGKEVTTNYTGAETLFENPSYAFYKLNTAPSHYKVLNADGSFGAVQGKVTEIEGVTGKTNYHTHHNNDVEMALSGLLKEANGRTVGVKAGDPVSGVIATDAKGHTYGLRHLVNLWRSTDIGWKDSSDPVSVLQGKKITKLRFITQNGIYDYPAELTTKPNGPKISAAFAGSSVIEVKGLPSDIANPKATVSYTVGEGRDAKHYNLAEDVAVNGGKISLPNYAKNGVTYEILVTCDNYADMETEATYTKKSSGGGGGGGTTVSSYTVNVADGITGGTVTVSPSKAYKNGQVTVTAKPDEGMQLASVTVTDKDGKTVPTSGTGERITFRMPAGGATVNATFVKQGEAPVPSDENAVIMRVGTKAYTIFGKNAAMDTAPVINSDNRTLVPIRFVSEALDATVDWNEEARTVTITKGETVVVMTIGDAAYTVNGEARTMDTAPIINADSRTLVPVRFVSEALGATVDYADGLITIRK